VPDAVVKAMAGRSGAVVAQRGSDKHLHYSRSVTVEEMRQASIALMQLVPTESVVRPESRDRGRDGGGRDRDSDEERLAATGTWSPSGLTLSGVRPDLGRLPTSLKLLRDLQVPIR
jgi:hypothetical protein